MTPCCKSSPTSSQVALGCLVSGYFPEPATVQWKKGSSTVSSGITTSSSGWDSSNGLYIMSSQLTVPADSWMSQKYQCSVTHQATSFQTTMDVECPLIPVPLQVNLLTPPCEGDSSPVLELICLLWDFTPNEAKVEWLVNGIKKDLPGTVYSSAEGTNGLFMGQSRVNISRESWNKEDVYTCKVSHPALSTDYEMRNASKCIPNRCDPRPVEVFLYPPSLEDIFVAHNTTITCLVTNLETPSNLEISWSRGSKGTLDVVTGKPVQQQNSTYSVTSILRVCAEEWKSGEQFTCTVKHPGIPSAITKSIHKTKATNLQAPSVYVYPPSADELSLQEVATLTCLAKGFRPSDIMVTWTQQGRPVSQETFINVGPVQDTAEKELNYFIYSKLSVLTNEWQRGDIFACVVGHEGLPMTFVQKSVDKASGKPTAVNVSVVLSDTEITCY